MKGGLSSAQSRGGRGRLQGFVPEQPGTGHTAQPWSPPPGPPAAPARPGPAEPPEPCRCLTDRGPHRRPRLSEPNRAHRVAPNPAVPCGPGRGTQIRTPAALHPVPGAPPVNQRRRRSPLAWRSGKRSSRAASRMESRGILNYNSQNAQRHRKRGRTRMRKCRTESSVAEVALRVSWRSRKWLSRGAEVRGVSWRRYRGGAGAERGGLGCGRERARRLQWPPAARGRDRVEQSRAARGP